MVTGLEMNGNTSKGINWGFVGAFVGFIGALAAVVIGYYVVVDIGYDRGVSSANVEVKELKAKLASYEKASKLNTVEFLEEAKLSIVVF